MRTQVGGTSFLLPVGGRDNMDLLTDAAACDEFWVSVDKAVGYMKRSGANVKIALLDCCRDRDPNDPLMNVAARSVVGGASSVLDVAMLNQMDLAINTCVVSAASDGAVAYDGTGANGRFVTELLPMIPTPGLSLHQLGMRLKKAVREAGGEADGGRQIVEVRDSMEADYYFMPPADVQ